MYNEYLNIKQLFNNSSKIKATDYIKNIIRLNLKILLNFYPSSIIKNKSIKYILTIPMSYTNNSYNCIEIYLIYDDNSFVYKERVVKQFESWFKNKA